MKFKPVSLFHLSYFQKAWITELPNAQPDAITYDYIVIGGGNAGLAVASRLTEDPTVTVAVLEAGLNVEDLPEVYIPGLVGTGQSFTTLNWAYETVPQGHLGGRTTTVNAGKALGGGTIINSMIFPRAGKEQYDQWGALNQDPSWSWESLLPYFRRSELVTPPTPEQIEDGVRFLPEVHGEADDGSLNKEGRVKTGFPNYIFPQSLLWHDASKLSISPDFSNGDPQGFVGISPNSLDANNNTRCSSVCAYLTPYMNRPNLKILTSSTATQILWDPTTTSPNPTAPPLRATGVEFMSSEGVVSRLFLTKEVILAAGTIGSPKVLELSGVGNTTILSAAGVMPVLELPTVGENLADHVHSWANAYSNATYTRDMLRLDPKFEETQRGLWYHNRTGLLSAAPRSLGLVSASGLFPESQLTSLLQDAQDNIEHYASVFSNGNSNLAKGIEAQHRLALELWERDRAAPIEINYEPGYSGPTPLNSRPARKFTSINAVLFGPLSRGRTHITSSSIHTASAIDPAYYAHPLDLATHVRGIQLGREMLRSPPLNSIHLGEYEPGEDKLSDAEVSVWAKEVAASDNHVVGTLSMMPQELGGVVDSRLKVYGTHNVRAVDASIIPFPISAHIMSTVYMIAEKAADMIKEDKPLI